MKAVSPHAAHHHACQNEATWANLLLQRKAKKLPDEGTQQV